LIGTLGGALELRPYLFAEENRKMNWTTLNFGKHRGKTLPQIIFEDADYFFWAYERDAFKGIQAREAREIYRRARAVRIPEQNGQKMLVEYRFEPRSGKFATMFLIPDGTIFERQTVSPVIDFYVPRSRGPYDKKGCKNLIFAFKAIYFGEQSHRLSKHACENFFNDDRNFVLN
jgi:hypothetical protein